MQVFITPDTGRIAGKRADAELHFSDGPLAGLKLVGFAVWERRGGGLNVTFPARQYAVNGERRSYALLRPTVDASGQDRLREIIINAYREYATGLDQPDQPTAQLPAPLPAGVRSIGFAAAQTPQPAPQPIGRAATYPGNAPTAQQRPLLDW